MQRSTLLATTVATCLAMAALANPAMAAAYTVNFSGPVVSTQGATGRTVGTTISGQFTLTDAGQFTAYTIDGRSPAPGYTSTAAYAPAVLNPPDAIYRAQLSPVLGGTSNSTFTLDFSALTSFPGATDTPFALLGDTTQIPANLDLASNPLSLFPSTFSYYTASTGGTNVVALTANLATIRVAPVPEPATLALLGGPLLVLAGLRRRRG